MNLNRFEHLTVYCKNKETLRFNKIFDYAENNVDVEDGTVAFAYISASDGKINIANFFYANIAGISAAPYTEDLIKLGILNEKGELNDK